MLSGAATWLGCAGGGGGYSGRQASGCLQRTTASRPRPAGEVWLEELEEGLLPRLACASAGVLVASSIPVCVCVDCRV